MQCKLGIELGCPGSLNGLQPDSRAWPGGSNFVTSFACLDEACDEGREGSNHEKGKAYCCFFGATE